MLKEKLLKDYNLDENLGYEETMLDEILDYSGRIDDEIIKECDIDLTSYNIVEDMEDYLEIYLKDIDNNDYIEDIDDLLKDMFNDYLIDNNLKED